MKKMLVVMLLAAAPAMAQYAGPWTMTWDFNGGDQGWAKTAGTGYWTDPGWVPAAGPVLPDGGNSGAGTNNLYAPDGTTFQYNLPTSVNSFVVQVDAWLPNLMPLAVDTYMPGNGLQNAGIGAITEVEGKHMYVSGSGTNGVKIRDHTWDNTDRTRSWLFEEAGVAKANMWDKWVTLQFDYNFSVPGKFTGYVYTPFDSGVHDGPGWYTFAQYDLHPEVAKQYVNRLIVGDVHPTAASWTQAQFDNIKFVPEPAAMMLLGLGMIPMLRRRRA